MVSYQNHRAFLPKYDQTVYIKGKSDQKYTISICNTVSIALYMISFFGLSWALYFFKMQPINLQWRVVLTLLHYVATLRKQFCHSLYNKVKRNSHICIKNYLSNHFHVGEYCIRHIIHDYLIIKWPVHRNDASINNSPKGKFWTTDTILRNLWINSLYSVSIRYSSIICAWLRRFQRKTAIISLFSAPFLEKWQTAPISVSYTHLRAHET